MFIFTLNKRTTQTSLLVLSLLLISACGGDKELTANNNVVDDSGVANYISGKAQKGGFLKGAVVMATRLDEQAVNGAETLSTTVSSNSGGFTIAPSWQGWTELNITGRFYDENAGSENLTELSLNSISEISSTSQSKINVNMFTHFVAARTRKAVNQNTNIGQAWDIAQSELKTALDLSSNEATVEKLDLFDGNSDLKSDNAILLLFSGGFMAADGSETALLALTDDFADDGKFNGNSTGIFKKISNYAGIEENLIKLSKNLKQRGIENPPEKEDLVAPVAWVNLQPKAVVTPASKTIVKDQMVTLSADSSSDPEGAQLHFNWSGAGTDNCGNSSECIPSILTAGEYSITLKVTDDKGSSDTAISTINVVEESDNNGAPNARLTVSSSETNVGDTVTFDASSSSDPDEDSLVFSWIGSGTQGCGNTNKCVIENITLGEHTVSVIVKDNSGASDSAERTITVISNDSENIPPLADAGFSNVITEGQILTLNAGKSSDSDGNIESYEWKKGSSIVARKAILVQKNLTEGAYTYTLKVTDNEGATDTDVIRVIVRARVTTDTSGSINQAPRANAGADKNIAEGDNLTLSARNSFDLDGSIESYEWKKDSIVVGRSSTLQQNSLLRGTHRYTLTVVDDDGASGTDTVTITVVASRNQAPRANAGVNKTINEGDSVTLSGSGSNDPDGRIVSYEWKKGSSVIGRSVTLTLNSLTRGTYTYTLMVTDNDGATDSDSVTVTVRPASTGIVINTISAQRCTSLGMATYSFKGGVRGTGSFSVRSYSGPNCTGAPEGLIVSTTPLTYSLSEIVTDASGASRAKMKITSLGRTETRRVRISSSGVVSL